MKRKLSIALLIFLTISLTALSPHVVEVGRDQILCETDSIEVVRRVVIPRSNEYDIDVVSLYLRNKFTDKEDLLLTTIYPEGFLWRVGDDDKFVSSSIDSIREISSAHVYREQPLQLIVEGHPDVTNINSYFIDVPTKNAWYVPANGGYMGKTWEGYMVFQSRMYVSNIDIAGHYTLLKIFDEDGILIDSLDLEHLILNK